MTGDGATIPVTISGLVADPITGLPVVLLVDDLGRTTVPISVGLSEASAIAAEIDRIELERPGTHRLMASMLERAHVQLLRVDVHALVEGVFYASVHMRLPCGEMVVQDARPSDALALALHAAVPINVAVSVIDEMTRLDLSARWDPDALAPSCDESEPLELLADDAFPKWKM